MLLGQAQASFKAPGEEREAPSRPPSPRGTRGHSTLAPMGTHCGWPQWACHLPRCPVLNTIRPRCMAASAPAHNAAYSWVPPLPRQDGGRQESECVPKGPLFPHPGSPTGPLSQMPHRRRRCPDHVGHFASPWPPPHHHLFLISLYSPAVSPPPPSTKHSIIPNHNWF